MGGQGLRRTDDSRGLAAHFHDPLAQIELHEGQRTEAPRELSFEELGIFRSDPERDEDANRAATPVRSPRKSRLCPGRGRPSPTPRAVGYACLRTMER
jgi:hypothetical protein